MNAGDEISLLGRLRRIGPYGCCIPLSLLLAALSLLAPSTPSYDPWSWLIWGREIIHGSLQLGGITSWKPLPVIFTTVFAFFRGAQPDLWLVVARAAFILSGFAIFRLAFRISSDLRRPGNDGYPLPPYLAGLLAIVALWLTGVYCENSALGYSESLAVAAVLIAFDCAYDGRHLAAYALGLVAALDRPEVFAFMVPYGLWLLWRRPRLRAWAAGLGVLALALWFVPQKIVTGSFSGSVKASEFVNPGSAGAFPCPFCHEMHYAAWPMAPVQLELMAGLAGVAAFLLLAWTVRRLAPQHGGDRRLPWTHRWELSRRQQALAVVSVAAAYGILWMVLIAFDVQSGFSGNERYMVIGSALLILAGSAGFGWAAQELGRVGVVRRGGVRNPRITPLSDTTSNGEQQVSGARGGPLATAQIIAATAICICVVAFVPKPINKRMISIGQTRLELDYQARLRTDLSALLGRLGPAAQVVACGTVVAEHFQIPMVAWYLKVPTTTIQDTPGEWKLWGSPQPNLPIGYPNIIVQASAAINPPSSTTGPRWERTAISPDAGDIGRWEAAGARYQVFQDGLVTVYKDCSARKPPN